ncbi:MAG: division/cell wall cluster transcriptional repressor MraZ [Verrucomicrobiae bacterium]|nr:division/cell wall cluster transcriptional repressor MraZ [Verrucomicrobiae bacterium]
MNAPFKASYADSFEHGFDAKGRITIPSEWRDEGYESQLFVFPSSEGCLKVYPSSWLARQQEKIIDLPLADKRRKKIEALAMIAQKIVWDAQGRVMISERLRQHAGLKKNAILAGALDHFEIWDEKLRKIRRETRLNLEDLGL